jgi:hypothetical protein
MRRSKASNRFQQTRRPRFLDAQISPDIPIHVVRDGKSASSAPEHHCARTSRHTDQFPERAIIETWADCGHALMWDAPQHVADAVLAIPTSDQDDEALRSPVGAALVAARRAGGSVSTIHPTYLPQTITDYATARPGGAD